MITATEAAKLTYSSNNPAIDADIQSVEETIIAMAKDGYASFTLGHNPRRVTLNALGDAGYSISTNSAGWTTISW